MVQTWLHRAVADELGDCRIGDGYGSWLTFFGGGDDVLDAPFHAGCIVFGDDGVLVNGLG